MKKFFGLLVVVIAMSGCSSDDDSNNTTTSIEGNWKMTAFNTENAYDLNGDGTASRNLMTETDCYQNETILFKADRTGVSTSNSYAEISLELVIGTTDQYEYSIECISETEVDAFTFTQTGDQVKLNVDGMIVNATLSNNTLTYVIPEGFFIETEGSDSQTITVIEDLTFIFTKQ